LVKNSSLSATTCSLPHEVSQARHRLGQANSILVKVNQIGSLTERSTPIEMAKEAGYTAVISHRSGETEDTTIATLPWRPNAGPDPRPAPSAAPTVSASTTITTNRRDLGRTLYMEAASNHELASSLWTRVQSLGFLVFVVVVASAIALLFVPLMHQRHAMQADIALLDREIAQQDALEKKQKTEIEALKTDSSYVERAARNKLNLARPNEVIFRFEPAPATALRQH